MLELLMRSPTQAAVELIEAANEGDELAVDWLTPLVRRGITGPFLRRVSSAVRNVELISTPSLDTKAQKFYWQKRLLPSKTLSREAVVGMTLVQLINTGLIERVQRCSAGDCDKFYFGARNKSFCSARCGGRIRGRNLRERERSNME